MASQPNTINAQRASRSNAQRQIEHCHCSGPASMIAIRSTTSLNVTVTTSHSIRIRCHAATAVSLTECRIIIVRRRQITSGSGSGSGRPVTCRRYVSTDAASPSAAAGIALDFSRISRTHARTAAPRYIMRTFRIWATRACRREGVAAAVATTWTTRRGS